MKIYGHISELFCWKIMKSVATCSAAGLMPASFFFTVLRAALVALIALFLSSFVNAQDMGSWNILSWKHPLSDRWQAFGEGQVRSLKFYDHFHYYEFKGGLSYRINSEMQVAGGIGRYDTYREGGDFVNPKQNSELRTWAQMTMKNRAGRVFIEHRYRAEQRQTSAGYRNRFRYRIGAAIPLNTREIETGTVYLNLWEEIFLTNLAPYFERSRSFIGIGWEAMDRLAFQLGYVHQFDYKINDETGRDFLQVSIYFETGGNQEKKSVHTPVN